MAIAEAYKHLEHAIEKSHSLSELHLLLQQLLDYGESKQSIVDYLNQLRLRFEDTNEESYDKTLEAMDIAVGFCNERFKLK
jgi:hypothetical protein